MGIQRNRIGAKAMKTSEVLQIWATSEEHASDQHRETLGPDGLTHLHFQPLFNQRSTTARPFSYGPRAAPMQRRGSRAAPGPGPGAQLRPLPPPPPRPFMEPPTPPPLRRPAGTSVLASASAAAEPHGTRSPLRGQAVKPSTA